jgi:hypothetical protein
MTPNSATVCTHLKTPEPPLGSGSQTIEYAVACPLTH